MSIMGRSSGDACFNPMPPDRPAALVALGKPALQEPSDELIERRPLRPSTGITLLWTGPPRDG